MQSLQTLGHRSGFAVTDDYVQAGHLLILHTLAFGGWRVPAVRLLWVVAIGLFLIWQPFVSGERRINVQQGVILLLAVAGSILVLGPWLLLIWCGALAAAIGYGYSNIFLNLLH